ncbi:MAG: DUF4145 domain-containing protein [Nitrososphaeraceae archaeon]
MSDTDINPEIVKELERVNKVWNDLIQNLHEKSNKDRVTAILVQVMIEYYVDRMLTIKGIIKSPDDLRYDLKLDELKKLKLIDSNLAESLLRIYKIRNIYSHEIEIHKKQILDLIDGISSVGDTTRFQASERVDKVREIIVRQVQRTYMDILVRKQEKSEKS